MATDSSDDMPRTQHALALFAGGLNCAQAIGMAFAPDAETARARETAWAGAGRGRAAEGHCGALFAALELVHTAPARAALLNLFQNNAGAAECRAIRRGRRLSCRGCVALAARFLESEPGPDQDGLAG